MYLVDTNIFLEGLLQQQESESVKSFFLDIDLGLMSITDLALHSIGIILFRLGKHELFVKFLHDLIIDGMEILSLGERDLKGLEKVSKTFHLDFDDAYQYAVAELHDLQLVSFDKDFDNTKRGRKQPGEVLA